MGLDVASSHWGQAMNFKAQSFQVSQFAFSALCLSLSM